MHCGAAAAEAITFTGTHAWFILHVKTEIKVLLVHYKAPWISEFPSCFVRGAHCGSAPLQAAAKHLARRIAKSYEYASKKATPSLLHGLRRWKRSHRLSPSNQTRRLMTSLAVNHGGQSMERTAARVSVGDACRGLSHSWCQSLTSPRWCQLWALNQPVWGAKMELVSMQTGRTRADEISLMLQ